MALFPAPPPALLAIFGIPFQLSLHSFFLALWRIQPRTDVYNILWVLVFGFATLNILALVARRFESDRSRLSFGELMAIMVVIVAVILLASEIFSMFKIFPIRLHNR